MSAAAGLAALLYRNPVATVRQWHRVDASNQVLGRLGMQIATILQGKHKPIYTPNGDVGDCVVVVNAAKVRLTGKKWEKKVYRWHTGWVGHLREVPAWRMLSRHPERLIELAVKGMLPKNPTRWALLRRLHVYPDEAHPHAAQLTASGGQWRPFERRLRLKHANGVDGQEQQSSEALPQLLDGSHEVGRTMTGLQAAMQQGDLLGEEDFVSEEERRELFRRGGFLMTWDDTAEKFDMKIEHVPRDPSLPPVVPVRVSERTMRRIDAEREKRERDLAGDDIVDTVDTRIRRMPSRPIIRDP